MGLSQLSRKVEEMLRQTCERSVETLARGETFRIDHRIRMIRVQAGRVWITWDNDDYVLKSGEEMLFPTGVEDAIVSVVEDDQAAFELLCIPREAD
jgi:hypothetical protein